MPLALSEFVKQPDVAARLKPFHPDRPKDKRPKAQVTAASRNPHHLGTAFDYLLRFELQRRHPHAEVRPWVAEAAPRNVRLVVKDGAVMWRVFFHDLPGAQPTPQEVHAKFLGILKAARIRHAEFLASPAPLPGQLRAVAADALKLAHLDLVIRPGLLDPNFEAADEGDIDILLDLLALIPFDQVVRPGRLLLNPVVGEANGLGGDADVITGGLLLDVKTTKTLEFKGEHFNQLLGYLLQARRLRVADPAFPEVTEQGLYFSRFAHVQTWPVAELVGRPGFAGLEGWWGEAAHRAVTC